MIIVSSLHISEVFIFSPFKGLNKTYEVIGFSFPIYFSKIAIIKSPEIL